MKKILLIDNYEFKDNILQGGQIISKRNYELFNLLKQEVHTFSIPSSPNKYSTFLNSLGKYSYGLSLKIELEILEKIKQERYDIIFLGSSVLGRLAKKIKEKNKKIKIITFFHNSETDFIKGYIKSKFFLYKFLENSFIFNESKTVKYSDVLIGLNQRDSTCVKKNYKRGFDILLPTTFKDNYNYKEYLKSSAKEKIDLLFIGSDFYGNVEGLKWFIENCLEKIDGQLIVIGKGMEKYKNDYTHKNLKILGAVEDLSEYYYRARAVVLPIISGSGMKTKTCESLMYGKYIFGTEEAFEGYDLDLVKVGGLCKTGEEFIYSLNTFLKRKESNFNSYSREIYLEKYNTEVLLRKLQKIICQL